jgi:membrane associated rhomboid family serine protease
MNITRERLMSSSLMRAKATIGGTRLIAACITGLCAAILIFAAPEVGIAGAIGGVAMGAVSAVLVRPHA